MKSYIYGVQPVLEAVRSGRTIEAIYLARASGGMTLAMRRPL